jgi:peptide/nickel transport system substrate-binding protein
MAVIQIGRALALLALVATASGCLGDGKEESVPEQRQQQAKLEFARGGTLRAAVPHIELYVYPVELPRSFDYFLDPQRLNDASSWELFRCCLLRTLLSYNGRTTSAGGIEPRPDLAAEMPRVSADGLTWTFRVKKGIRYAPPLAEIEVTAPDFIRALERTLRPSPAAVAELIGPQVGVYSHYYLGVIAGAQDFADGQADTISGLEAPDDHTLVVHLTRPTGDLGYRFSLGATAPIPPHPSKPDARLGAAEGHDDGYGRFLVSTGPYMLEGAEKLDFAAAPAKQKSVSGYVRGKSVTLVRNPSWDAATDALRPAYADRIELPMGGTAEQASRKVDRGEVDLVFDANAPVEQAERYRRDPELRDRAITIPCDWVFAIPMNLAVRPFDDIHVRKAVNLAVNKAGLRRLLNDRPFWWGYAWGTPTGHISIDAITRNLLVGYDPYRTAGDRGDLEKAKTEMARSRYDSDSDGVCDDPACKNVRILTWREVALPKMAAFVRDSLEQIGIGLDVDVAPDYETYLERSVPSSRTAATIGDLWGGEYPNGSAFFVPRFGRPELNGSNVSLLGATKGQLEEWGYSVRSVPSVHDRIERCLPLVGRAQFECWAQLDQFLMEEIVPWVPYALHAHTNVLSKRIKYFSMDQFTAQASLDRIALVSASE